MKRYTILALAMSVASLAQAETPAFSFNEWLPGCFKLFDAKRDHAENPWVQEVNFRFRPQYQWGYMDPAGGAERGQQLFAVQSHALAMCLSLHSQLKAGYRHLADFLGALSREQGEELSALTAQLRSFTDSFRDTRDAELQVRARELNARFTDSLTRHLMHHAESESELRNSLLFLTLLNETRAMAGSALRLRATLEDVQCTKDNVQILK